MGVLEPLGIVVNSVFAGKGLIEHGVGAQGDDPDLAIAGLGSDAVGNLFFARELVRKQAARAATKAAQKLGTEAAANLAEKAAQRVEAAGTPIIGAGLLAINGMQLLCGLTFEQDKGEKFGQASDAMQTVSDTLDSASPREDWQSAGSTAYTEQNSRQHDRADAVSKTDRKIQGIIAHQAGQVKNTKDLLDKAAIGLTVMIPVVLATRPWVPFGPAIAEGMEIAAVAAAMAVCLPKMAGMLGDASANASQIASAAAEYQQVATGAKPSGGTHAFDSPPTTAQPPATTNPTPAPPAPSAPGPAPSGGGGAPSGGGGAPSGGGGAPSGGGGTPSPSAPSMPTMPAMPSAADGGSSGGIGELAKAMGSALGGQSGGGGGLGGILSAIPQIVTSAIQAGQQSGQQAGQQAGQQDGQQAGQQAGQMDADRTEGWKDKEAASHEDGNSPRDGSTKTGQPDESKPGAGAGSQVPGERAPVESASQGQASASAPRTPPVSQPPHQEQDRR